MAPDDPLSTAILAELSSFARFCWIRSRRFLLVGRLNFSWRNPLWVHGFQAETNHSAYSDRFTELPIKIERGRLYADIASGQAWLGFFPKMEKSIRSDMTGQNSGFRKCERTKPRNGEVTGECPRCFASFRRLVLSRGIAGPGREAGSRCRCVLVGQQRRRRPRRAGL